MNEIEILELAKAYVNRGGELYGVFIGKKLQLFGIKLLVILDPDMEPGTLLFQSKEDTIRLINLKGESNGSLDE